MLPLDDNEIRTSPVGDDLVLSPSIMKKYGRAISLTTMTYAEAIALLASSAAEKCSSLVDYDLNDATLQSAVAATRVDVGTMVMFALDQYCDDQDVAPSEVSSFDQLRPYWVEAQTKQAFSIYQEYSHARLRDIVYSMIGFMPQITLSPEDMLWVVHRLNDALMTKFRDTQSEEVLDIATHRAAVITFYADHLPVLIGAVGDVVPMYKEGSDVVLTDRALLSSRAQVWHNLATLVSVTA